MSIPSLRQVSFGIPFMSIRKKTIAGAKWTLLQNLGSQVFSLAVFLVLVRLLEPAEFGLFALAYVYASLITLIVNSGFESALIQREQLEPEHLHTAFWVNIGLAIGLAVLTLAGAPWIAKVFGTAELGPIISLMSVAFVINSPVAVQRALLRRELNFKTLSTRILIANFLANAAAVGFALAGFGVWSLVGREIVSGLLLILLLWTATRWRPRFMFSMRHFREIYAFGMHVMGNNLFRFFIQRSDNFLIGVFLGTTALGFYSVAYRILDLMIQVTTKTIVSVAMPSLSRLQADQTRFASGVGQINIVVVQASVPIFLGIAVLAPDIIPLLFGEKWIASVPVMQVLAITGISQSVGHLLSTAIVALGRPGLQLALRGVEGLAVVSAFFIAVTHGIEAVAIALTIVNVLMVPVWYIALQRLLVSARLQVGGDLLRVAICGVTMALAVFNLREYALLAWNPWLALATLAAAGAAVYLAMTAFLLPGSVKLLMNILRRKM